MNCNEVTAILDDGRMDKLDPEQRRQVEAHKAGCVVCARGWNAQAAIAALPDLAIPAGLAMQCRAVVAAPPVARDHSGRKWLLVGSVAALAAAAAVVALLLRPAAQEVVKVAHAPVGAEQIAPPVQAEAASHEAEVVPAIAEAPASAPRVTVRLVAYEVPPDFRYGTTPSTNPLGFSEADFEVLRRDANEPVRMQARQAISAAVLAELRKVPGVALVDADPIEIPPDTRHYRVSVTMSISLGMDRHVAPLDSRIVAVGLGAEQLKPGGESIRRTASSLYIDLQGNCARAAGPQSTCRDLQAEAREFVNKLRLETFPPEPSATRPLFARLGDSSLDVAQRLAALKDLYTLQARTGESSLLRNAGAVRAVIELARLVEPAQRAQLWRSLRGVGDPALTDSLLASLIQDPDDVRLAAADMLGADFKSDARVRSALEAAALNDPRPLVRAVVQRGLSGEEGWRQYVAGSLKNGSLPAAQRLEALVYYLYPPGPDGNSGSNPDYFDNLGAVMDDAAVTAFAEALPKAGRLPGGVNAILLSNIAARNRNNAALTKMLLDDLDHGAEIRNRRLAAELLVHSRPNEPEVRDALTRALQNDPDPGVRTYIRQLLGDKAP